MAERSHPLTNRLRKFTTNELRTKLASCPPTLEQADALAAEELWDMDREPVLALLRAYRAREEKAPRSGEWDGA